jgi:hypothetical protein
VTTYNPRLLTPIEQEDVYPYRRVWVSIAIENSVLFGMAAVLYLVITIFGVNLPTQLYLPINIVLVAAPVLLWLTFSYLRERSVVQPRERLLTVLVIGALVANAVGIPVIEQVFQTERWLPLSNGVVRIVGYTVTFGAFQEVLKYLVMRYTTWPVLFRIRLDGVAYSAACSVGYASILNLNFLLTTNTDPSTMALHIFDNMALHTAASIIVGYGLSLLRFDKPAPFLMPFTVALSALIHGVVIPLRTGLSNAGFSLEGSFPAPIFSLGLSAILLIGVISVMSVLFARADRQEEEAIGSER